MGTIEQGLLMTTTNPCTEDDPAVMITHPPRPLARASKHDLNRAPGRVWVDADPT